jgi:hypothetical protein
MRSLLYDRSINGDYGAIVDLYQRHGILERALEHDGCLSAQVETPVDTGHDVLVTAPWRELAGNGWWARSSVRMLSAAAPAHVVDRLLASAARRAFWGVATRAGRR